MRFGYPWWMSYGHLILGLPAALAAAWLFRRRKARKTRWLAAGFALWTVAAFLIVQFGFRLNSPLLIPVSKFLASGRGKVLDMGCGSGRSAIGLLLARPQATVIGLDNWSAEYIQTNGPDRTEANARAAGVADRLTVLNGDMRDLPFGDGVFDAVMSAYAIDHLDGAGILRALTEAARVLRPGGEILVLNMANDGWAKFVFPPLLLGSHAQAVGHAVSSGHESPAASGEAHWRKLLAHVGFEAIESGRRPGTLYVLARKPESGSPRP